MQVCSIAVAGIAAVADQLTLLHLLTLLDNNLIKMCVQRFERTILVCSVFQLDHVAIAVCIAAGALAIPVVRDCNRAGLRSVHWRAHRCAEIQRPVQAAVIVEPACGDNVLGQGPMQQGFFILQPHLYPPYLVLFHIHTDK